MRRAAQTGATHRRLPGPLRVFVSGLPASGKSTLAAALAARLRWPLLDRDDRLEALFDAHGCRDAATRQVLSRQADDGLVEAAAALPATLAAVLLVSWWRHPRSPDGGGTPPERLLTGPAGEPLRRLELHCRCAPALAAERFLARRRHPGHLDPQRDRAATLAMFERQHACGPLWPAEAIVVDTAQPLPDEALAALRRRLQAAIDADAAAGAGACASAAPTADLR